MVYVFVITFTFFRDLILSTEEGITSNFKVVSSTTQLIQHWINVQCLRESPPAQQTQDICITFIQRRPNVFDVDPTLHKVIQMFCVYWACQYKLGSSSCNIPAVIQSVCLQASDQVGVGLRALNYKLIDVAQVYMNLLWFENLLLMRLWVWNAYLVLLWKRDLAYPRALLPSGGPLSREFWQLTTPLKFIAAITKVILATKN